MIWSAPRTYLDESPIALAHRGGAAYAPNLGRENTLAAFAEATALGYRYLETDVHASADGAVVVMHDRTIDRMTDRVGQIAALPLSQIRAARIAGAEQVPLLAEVFEQFPQARINIDIKAGGAVAPLWELIEHHRAHERVCVGSFSPLRLQRFRRLSAARVATAASPVGTAALRFLPQVLHAIAHTPAEVVQIPVNHTLHGHTLRVLTTKLLAAAHQLGKQVHIWTIDEAAQMHDLLDLGVDGIVSDRIDVLKDVLIERGQW